MIIKFIMKKFPTKIKRITILLFILNIAVYNIHAQYSTKSTNTNNSNNTNNQSINKNADKEEGDFTRSKNLLEFNKDNKSQLEKEQESKSSKFYEFQKEGIDKEKLLQKIKQSKIEKMYNGRFPSMKDELLKQYGYDFFKNFKKDKFLPVGDNYIVGPGDTVAIYLWGAPVDILKMRGFQTVKVDRDGKIYINKLGVFYIWGLKISDVNKILFKAMRRKFRNFELEVTLGRLREFPVYVSGYVKEPGIIMATGVSNVIDVVSQAGGIEKNGTMRNISIRRIEKDKIKIITIDLYELLINGNPIDAVVKEGDSILVNSIDKTSGISGGVKRPAIYEITDEKNSIKKLIEMSGGVLPSVYTPGVKLCRYEENKLRIFKGTLDNEEFINQELKSGDYVLIDKLYNFVENEIVVKGHVSYPGKYSYKDGIKLSELMKNVGILPDTNIKSGGIWRDNLNKIINFNPKEIIEGKNDIELQKKDIIHFYPKRINEPIQVMGEVTNPGIMQYYKDITLLEVLHNIKFNKPARFLKAEIFLENGDKIISETVYLKDLLIKGEKESNLKLLPGTKILVRETETNERRKSLTVLGEVKKPGVYNYKQGIKLYDLLIQTGGYTENAYPRGLILVRNSAKKLQEEHIKISFLSMEEHLAKSSEAFSSAGSSPEEQSMLQITMERYRRMITILKKKSELALGRVALDIPTDLKKLKNDPENIKLVDGDLIYIPKEPNYVLVLGDVYNQMSLPYDTGKTVKYYLGQLGGMAEHADKDNIYIIKANGKIISKKQYSSITGLFFSIDWKRKKLNFSRNFESIRLEQGDTIVVPTELKVPIMWRPILKDIAQIMFQTMSTVIMATKL